PHCRAPASASSVYTCRATTAIITLSLHDALPISRKNHYQDRAGIGGKDCGDQRIDMYRLPHGLPDAGDHGSGRNPSGGGKYLQRSEEHTSELQSRFDLVCRLLLAKKNNTISTHTV